MWFVGYDHSVYALNCDGCDSSIWCEGSHFIVSLGVAFGSSYGKEVRYLVIQ